MLHTTDFSNCKFIAGDVFKVLDEIEEKPDVIVLDPPRDGIHPKALPKILDYGVDKIVYISCKVTSLARDLEMIQARGYEVVKSVAVDQFLSDGACGDDGVATETRYIEILEFTHFVRFFQLPYLGYK